jgi:hypothetical protein
MCIISGPVDRVSGTQIFVAPSLDGRRQIVVYKNTVATRQPNMMILPVPNPTTVRFEESVMRYATLFEDAAASFTKFSAYRGGEAAWSRGTLSVAPAPLPVQIVGPYQASIVPSIEDLDRLDPTVFQMSAELHNLLTSTYAFGANHAPIGFVCCVLRAGKHAYEPIAYSHDITEGSLFVPTKHFHSGETLRELAQDWDHEIYSLGTDLSRAHKQFDTTHYRPRPQNEIQWRHFTAEFRHPPSRELRLWSCQGVYTNTDLIFPLQQKSPLLQPRAPSPRRRNSGTIEHSFKSLWGLWR